MIIGKKQIIIIAIIVFLATLFFIGVVVVKKNSYSKYLNVEAEIESVTTELSGSSNQSRSHYITYKYEVNNEYYSAKRQVFSKNFKKAGDIDIIRYNPEDPNQIENTLLINTSIVLVVFFLAWNVVLLISIRRTR